MSLPISIKAEKALALGYLPTALAAVTGLHIYEGHEKAAKAELPNLIVNAEGSAGFPGMPAECVVKNVRIRCKFNINSTANTRDDVNAWKELLETAMVENIEALKTALNKPLAGADGRTVKEIHFHSVEMEDDPSEREESNWVEDLVFVVVCELLDS